MILPIIVGLAIVLGVAAYLLSRRGRPPDHTVTRRRAVRGLAAVASAVALVWLIPGIALGHQLSGQYQSRLPLAVYLVGAATTVALSFVFVLVRDVRAERPKMDEPRHLPPAAIRYTLKALGLIAWIWVVAQGIAGGESNGDVTHIFLWVYGWVGVAMASFLIGPVWQFFDPFSTLHDAGALGPAPGRGHRLGPGRLPGRASAAGRPWSASSSWSGWSSSWCPRRRRCSSSSSATPR